MTRKKVSLQSSTRERFARIVQKLLEWHDANQRLFIWRGVKRTPYVVLVSEFMLQQTGTRQVEQMLPPFLKRFPNFKALAEAPIADVLKAWQGLGYNRRALNLHNAAKAIVARGRRPFPRTIEELKELPGVGDYTAASVLAFVHNADVPVVDVNIERVLSRLWKEMPSYDGKLPMAEIFSLDEQIFPRGSSAKWHEALMDHGATICTKRNPNCKECSLLLECRSGPHFLKVGNSIPAQVAAKREPQYFGYPRRIWRGRLLSLITSGAIKREGKLIEEMVKVYKQDNDEFREFIKMLIALLIADSFAIRERGNILLPKG